MSLNDEVALDRLHASTTELETNFEQDRSQQWEANRSRLAVVIGSAILQLPIWGFAMSYGVFQEYFTTSWPLPGTPALTGIIGTTSNGVMYLSMPFFFALFTRRFASHRRTAALSGALLTCLSFLLSSFSTEAWHLIATQGVLAALGCALIYSPMTLSLGEWFTTSNRALAYGTIYSCKNIVGASCPFLFQLLLNRFDFAMTMRIFTAITAVTSIPVIFMIPTHSSAIARSRTRRIPWAFMRRRSIWVYSIAICLQSAGYGIPQTYLNTYAHSITHASQTSATLLLTLFNLPGILSGIFFGYLSDNKHFPLSATTVTAIPAVSSGLSAFLFWGLTTHGSFALLIIFSITFGFFAGGYSSTWAGVINEMEIEAARQNEAIDAGMVYGLLNGARGVGYVSGGLAGVPLLKPGAEGMSKLGGFGYGTSYGPLIIFTGISSVLGGWGLLWKWKWKNLAHVLRVE